VKGLADVQVTASAAATVAAETRPVVIDADGHILEPADLWGGEYMDPEFRDRGPTVSMTDGRLYRKDGSPFPTDRVWNGTASLGFERNEDVAPIYSDARPGATDPHGRIEDLDLEGIDAVMLYPTVGLALGFEEDPLLAGAMARAYNRWLSEWCGEVPDRLYAVGMIPTQSVDVAVAELHFAREQLGVTAAVIRPHAYRGVMIYDPEWERFWATAQDLDCPVALHGGAGWPEPQAGADRFTNAQTDLVHIICHPFEQQIAFVGLIGTGMFDRFPNLRVAFLESGGAWVVPLLDRLERHYDQDFDIANRRKRPTEYFHDNCWISFEPVESSLGLLADRIGPANILWASDYPHQDGFFPGVLAKLEASMTGCSPQARSGILGGGAQAFYGVAS
jgi:predicted TIM-barrel fold metal-dependent hydrolase